MSSPSQRQSKLDGKDAFNEVGVLSEVVSNLRALFLDEGYLPDDPGKINSQLTEASLDNTRVTSRHIESLVALGVLGRVIAGGHSYLAWMDVRHANRSVPALVKSPDLLPKPEMEIAKATETSQAVETNELFKIDVELDMEHEKLLLYRSLIVVEVIAGLLLLRQMLLWFY